jgi:hypothetical protein
MQSAKSRYRPELNIRVFRARTGTWEDYGRVGSLRFRFKQWLDKLKGKHDDGSLLRR